MKHIARIQEELLEKLPRVISVERRDVYGK